MKQLLLLTTILAALPSVSEAQSDLRKIGKFLQGIQEFQNQQDNGNQQQPPPNQSETPLPYKVDPNSSGNQNRGSFDGRGFFNPDGRYLVTVDNNGQIVVWDWSRRSIIKRIPARDPGKPIIDSLHFATSEPYLLSVEHDGPHVYRLPDGAEMTANDYMPPKMIGWMYDILQNKVQWPFETVNSPRTYEMLMDKNVWLAAGVGKSGGKSKPWVSTWAARGQGAQQKNAPQVTYHGHRWEVFAVAISKNKDFVVSGDKFGEVHIWEAHQSFLKFVWQPAVLGTQFV